MISQKPTFSPVAQTIYDGFIQDFLLPKLDELYAQSITPNAKKVLCLVLYAVVTLEPIKFNVLLADYYQLPQFDIVKRLMIEYNQIAFNTAPDYPPLEAVLDPRLYPLKFERAILIELFCNSFKMDIVNWLKRHYPEDLDKAIKNILQRFGLAFQAN